MNNQVDVTIITRTKDRLVFLQRATKSISRQTVLPKEWIIFNDGGEDVQKEHLNLPETLKDVDVQIVNSEHVGRSRAANTSARQAKGKYVLIHDDDDSLEIDFLAQTTAFLQNHPNYVGVVTHTMCVAERIDEDTGNIVTLKTSPENFFVKNILISHMLQQNLFSPIAFLCDRNVFVNAGGYCEDVDTLEDYYLNLKILAEHGDIGLIQKHLANHHIRHKKHKNDSFDNTVTVGLQSHHESEVIMKNKLLREDFQNNKNGLGILWAIADMTKGSREVQRLFANIENRVNNSRILRFFKSKLLAG